MSGAGRNLTLVGGGHAHLTVLLKARDYVERGHSVTLISPVTHHYYSGMGPGMLSQIYAPQEVRFHIKKMIEDRGGSFVRGKVVRIDPREKTLFLESGESLPYDVVSFNTGSSVPAPKGFGQGSNGVFPVKPIVNLLRAQNAIIEAIANSTPRILVAGGGPAGVELTGNVQRLVARNNGRAEITLVGGKRILAAFNEKARSLALKSLLKRDIKVLENTYLDRIQDGKAITTDGSGFSYDFLFPAVGVTPSPLFAESGLPVGPDNGLLVNEKLQSVAYPEIFGGGDCISLQGRSLDKVGVYAVRQNLILYKNLMAVLESGPMDTFQPQEKYLLIFNLGDGSGIFIKNSWTWNGKAAFMIKDYIDRKFMRKYQVSGETDDHSEILD